LDFVNAGENLVMVDDVATPLNSLVAPVEKEELEETLLDVNVFQWLCKENRLQEWCALESIVWHGIVNCVLTHMP